MQNESCHTRNNLVILPREFIVLDDATGTTVQNQLVCARLLAKCDWILRQQPSFIDIKGCTSVTDPVYQARFATEDASKLAHFKKTYATCKLALGSSVRGYIANTASPER